jgi:selenoprotein W-related protein
VSLAAELMGHWAPIMRGLELRSGASGRFEITLNDELIFSKAELGRFPKAKEVARSFEKKLGAPLAWREEH